jgi:CRISPR-associated protein Cas5d
MHNLNYPVEMEIAGPAAMFSRPDTGSAFVSYPAPTYSAAKGMFESIVRFKSAYVHPIRVEICRPVRFHRYATNYGGPLRKPAKLKDGTGYQLQAVILVDVCYRLYGEVRAAGPAPGKANHRHALQEVFNRRLHNGQWFSTPCLGWQEFTPSYLGPFRGATRVEKTLELEIPSMLHSVFSAPVAGEYAPRYKQNVKISGGVLAYAE